MEKTFSKIVNTFSFRRLQLNVYRLTISKIIFPDYSKLSIQISNFSSEYFIINISTSCWRSRRGPFQVIDLTVPLLRYIVLMRSTIKLKSAGLIVYINLSKRCTRKLLLSFYSPTIFDTGVINQVVIGILPKLLAKLHYACRFIHVNRYYVWNLFSLWENFLWCVSVSWIFPSAFSKMLNYKPSLPIGRITFVYSSESVIENERFMLDFFGILQR